jgi:hypothetical protein
LYFCNKRWRSLRQLVKTPKKAAIAAAFALPTARGAGVISVKLSYGRPSWRRSAKWRAGAHEGGQP